MSLSYDPKVSNFESLRVGPLFICNVHVYMVMVWACVYNVLGQSLDCSSEMKNTL